MAYAIAPLRPSPDELKGLSERLIASHYENNYGGAVRRLNAIRRDLDALDPAAAAVYLVNGLKREELIAMNSMRLHEIYFDGLGRGALGGVLAEALERDFGGVPRWRAEFTGMGKALGGGSGWVLLSYLRRDRRLVNQWAADHAHVFADATQILSLDMYENAYHLDYGAKAGAYVDAFMDNIDWARIAANFAAASGGPEIPQADPRAVAPEAVLVAANKGALTLLDVRRKARFDQAADMIAGAQWRDPAAADAWAGEIAKDRPVVVYCVYGHHVSHGVADALSKRGIDARYLEGGIAAWRAIGGAMQPKT
ncbi:MAG: Fe-Mn family superoxide dismutase [Rhodospirillales bacterium]